MAIYGWDENPNAEAPCKTPRESWQCPNMKEVSSDFDGIYNECSVCGRKVFLDYEEMK